MSDMDFHPAEPAANEGADPAADAAPAINYDAPRAGLSLSDEDWAALSPEGKQAIGNIRSSAKLQDRRVSKELREMRETLNQLRTTQAQPQATKAADPNDYSTYKDEEIVQALTRSRQIRELRLQKPDDAAVAAEYAKLGDGSWEFHAQAELAARKLRPELAREVGSLRSASTGEKKVAALNNALTAALGPETMRQILKPNGKGFNDEHPLVERAIALAQETAFARGLDMQNDDVAMLLVEQAFVRAQNEFRPASGRRPGLPATSAANGSASNARADHGAATIAALLRKGDAESVVRANELAVNEMIFGSGQIAPEFAVNNRPQR